MCISYLSLRSLQRQFEGIGRGSTKWEIILLRTSALVLVVYAAEGRVVYFILLAALRHVYRHLKATFPARSII